MNGTDFGILSQTFSRTFYVINTGTAPLHFINDPAITITTVSGRESAFEIINQPERADVSAGTAASFVIQFTPSSIDFTTIDQAIISVSTTKGDDFQFNIQAGSRDPDLRPTLIDSFTVTGELDTNSGPIVMGIAGDPLPGPATNNGTIIGVEPTEASNTGFRTTTITVTNTSSETLNFATNVDGSIVTVVDSQSALSVTQPSVTTLAPNASTNFNLTYQPEATSTLTTLGEVTFAFETAANVSDAPFRFLVEGRPLTPNIELSGNNLTILNGDLEVSNEDGTDFGTVIAGDAPAITSSFQVTNTGSANLVIDAIDFTLDGAESPSAEFTITNPTIFPLNLTPGETQVITVSYDPRANETPSGEGRYTGVITLRPNESARRFIDNFLFAVSVQQIGANLDLFGTNRDELVEISDFTPFNFEALRVSGAGARAGQ